MLSRFLLTLSALVIFSVASIAQKSPDFTAAQTEAVKFLGDLVKIDTSNPPGNETRAAEYIKGILAAEGITAQIFESAPGRGNLVARLKGNGKKKPHRKCRAVFQWSRMGPAGTALPLDWITPSLTWLPRSTKSPAGKLPCV